MKERISNEKINREKGWLYYIDKDGDVSACPMAKGKESFRHLSRKILKLGVKREKGHLYFIDKEGYICKTEMSGHIEKNVKETIKKYQCEMCGRPINQKGNCLPCNYKKKYGKPFVSRTKYEKQTKSIGAESFIKSILDKDEYGNRLLIKRKQNKDENFRKYIFERYRNSCFFCNNRNLPLDIHHINYEIRCRFPEYRRRKVKIITCTNCKKRSPDVFEECMNSVILLCRDCHEKLHIMMKESFGEWVPPVIQNRK
jgi:hypothetical protein